MINYFIRLRDSVKSFDTFLEYNKLRPECRGLTFDGFLVRSLKAKN